VSRFRRHCLARVPPQGVFGVTGNDLPAGTTSFPEVHARMSGIYSISDMRRQRLNRQTVQEDTWTEPKAMTILAWLSMGFLILFAAAMLAATAIVLWHGIPAV
jgi:hypothetical protein